MGRMKNKDHKDSVDKATFFSEQEKCHKFIIMDNFAQLPFRISWLWLGNLGANVCTYFI